MTKEILRFGNMKIEKHKFCHYESPVILEDVDIDNTLFSNKISFGSKSYKYFIDYFVIIIKLNHHDGPNKCIFV